MTVTLLDHMGSDLSIVNFARTSYDKESTWARWWVCSYCRRDLTPEEMERDTCPDHASATILRQSGRLRDADAGLINYLVREHHGSPVEAPEFVFRVHTSIAVAREWMRHRVASYSEVSTRYVEMKPEFYVPEPAAVRTQVGKPGHYTMEAMTDEDTEASQNMMRLAYESSYSLYTALLLNGVAKELARNVLPLGLMTTFIFKVNLRSLFNFLGLRLAPNALLEIRQEAEEIYRLIEPLVPVTVAAWERYSRPIGEDWHDCAACNLGHD